MHGPNVDQYMWSISEVEALYSKRHGLFFLALHRLIHVIDHVIEQAQRLINFTWTDLCLYTKKHYRLCIV